MQKILLLPEMQGRGAHAYLLRGLANPQETRVCDFDPWLFLPGESPERCKSSLDLEPFAGQFSMALIYQGQRACELALVNRLHDFLCPLPAISSSHAADRLERSKMPRGVEPIAILAALSRRQQAPGFIIADLLNTHFTRSGQVDSTQMLIVLHV